LGYLGLLRSRHEHFLGLSDTVFHRFGNTLVGGDDLIGLCPGIIHFSPLHKREENNACCQDDNSYVSPFRFIHHWTVLIRRDLPA
jgi:hypothetical protein